MVVEVVIYQVLQITILIIMIIMATIKMGKQLTLLRPRFSERPKHKVKTQNPYRLHAPNWADDALMSKKYK